MTRNVEALQEELSLLKAENSFIIEFWGLDKDLVKAAWDKSISKRVALDKLALHKQQEEVFLEDTDERSCTKHKARQEACRAFKEEV